MSGVDDLRHELAGAHTHVDDARAHAGRARELLETTRETLVEAQAVAEPWLPAQLLSALDELDTHTAQLSRVRYLLDSYQARL